MVETEVTPTRSASAGTFPRSRPRGLEPPELRGVAAEDLLAVRRGEEGNLLADQVQLLLERGPPVLGAGHARKPCPPQQAVRAEGLVQALHPRQGVPEGILARRR